MGAYIDNPNNSSIFEGLQASLSLVGIALFFLQVRARGCLGGGGGYVPVPSGHRPILPAGDDRGVLHPLSHANPHPLLHPFLLLLLWFRMSSSRAISPLEIPPSSQHLLRVFRPFTPTTHTTAASPLICMLMYVCFSSLSLKLLPLECRRSAPTARTTAGGRVASCGEPSPCTLSTSRHQWQVRGRLHLDLHLDICRLCMVLYIWI